MSLEGDSDWLKRALRVVGQTVDLTPYASSSPQAPHNAIHRELYVSLRTAIFHSKKGRTTWTPQAWSSRAMIVEARIRYARMFRTLAAEYLGMRYPSGGFAQGFWEHVGDHSQRFPALRQRRPHEGRRRARR